MPISFQPEIKEYNLSYSMIARLLGREHREVRDKVVEMAGPANAMGATGSSPTSAERGSANCIATATR